MTLDDFRPVKPSSPSSSASAAASSDDVNGSAEIPAAVTGGGDPVVVGDGADGAEDSPHEADDRPRGGGMSLSEIAHSDEHKLTHKPFNKHCPVCVKAKSSNKPHRRKAFQRELDHFGQIVALDHTDVDDKDFEPGVFNMKSCLEILDFHTRFAYAYPVREGPRYDRTTPERLQRGRHD